MRRVTVIGGGFAGLVAAITCAEAGVQVLLLEAHKTLGGRARATKGPYVAHDGPHVLYADGPWWRWLAERRLIGTYEGFPWRGMTSLRFFHNGQLCALPPRELMTTLMHRRRKAPDDMTFHDWIGKRMVSNLMGVATFDADPGRLSASFVWERLLRVFAPSPPARYVTGGWNGLVDRLAGYARARGVAIETGIRVTEIAAPAIVATTLDSANQLLGTRMSVESGRTVLLDIALRARRGDCFVVSDLDSAGWLERYTLPDPSLAPPGESLVQAHMPLRLGENKSEALARLEALVDQALPGWRDRLTWRRDGVANRRTGALDLPGQTWRDRPAVRQGDGVYLAGDMVAAPGLLSEVSFHSAIAAAREATACSSGRNR